MTDIAVECDLGSLFGDVRDQGDRPTCLAFAASDAHAALRAGWEPLSCEYAFYQAQRRSNKRKDGPIWMQRPRTARTGAHRKTSVKSIAVLAPSDLKASTKFFSHLMRESRSWS